MRKNKQKEVKTICLYEREKSQRIRNNIKYTLICRQLPTLLSWRDGRTSRAYVQLFHYSASRVWVYALKHTPAKRNEKTKYWSNRFIIYYFKRYEERRHTEKRTNIYFRLTLRTFDSLVFVFRFVLTSRDSRVCVVWCRVTSPSSFSYNRFLFLFNSPKLKDVK